MIRTKFHLLNLWNLTPDDPLDAILAQGLLLKRCYRDDVTDLSIHLVSQDSYALRDIYYFRSEKF